MHEVSFQDKEKEHLTRLQDAEEMKVCTPPLPWNRRAFGLRFLILGKSVSFGDVWGSVGGRGEGPVPGRQSDSHSAAWPRTERRTEVSRSPERSVASRHAALVRASSVFLGEGKEQPLPVPAWATLPS